MSLIKRLENGESLKNFNIKELNELAGEIRSFLIDKVAENGGHLASNLGIVELTIALHYVFDFPSDKIIWDVGHQSYVHKILSGRADGFNSLRKLGGLSGFPKTSESPYDCFNTGHASTSISAALGMARARDISGENNEIIAVIGDGSLGGGLAYEAINDIGDTKLLVILNDNKMSISENVGAVSQYLNSIRTSGRYFKLKHAVFSFLQKTEQKKLLRFIRKIKNSIKHALIQNSLFESLGLTYFGPFDGHDVGQLIKILNRVKNLNEGVLMHIRTTKGKGYEPAEQMPQDYHGVSSFDSSVGNIKKYKKDYSAIFGETLCKIAKENKNVVGITAAMPDGTGLKEFAEKFPDRFFDVGIAEEHAVTMAAGMASNGLVPVVAIYSSFMQRAFDSILHDVCLQGLHVVLCADRAGVVGADGETHQGIFDLSYMKMMPGITVLAPCDFSSLEEMLEFAVNKCSGPVFIRYPRGSEDKEIKHTKPFEISRADMLKKGTDVAIVACGKMVSSSLDTADILEEKGISASVIDVQTVYPLDKELINELKDYKLVVTVEDNVKAGGMGEEIVCKLSENKVSADTLVKAYKIGIVEQGTVKELMKIHGLDSESVAAEIEKRFN